ncbi:hypothetical protein COU61_02165 [Candidatus Pacearchaeota archaeon CG10_big_fil_rev_8_21_14_0_10_35_13]|nr:MAG: hypothetical protein COU61_02165 [Candidatus Pacearchaeota archaeon CG10_big_fil_rev_8_21_14_0_10_35_13]
MKVLGYGSSLKEGVSRKIIFSGKFSFFAPEHTIGEVKKYNKVIITKARISSEELDILLSLIFDNINILPMRAYDKHLRRANGLISDAGDVPFIALALALKADGIWSEDKHFQQQNKIKIFRTDEMLKLI